MNLFLVSVIDIYSKYAWVVLLKDKKGITITKAIQKALDESERKASILGHKLNKIWADKDSEFYIISMKSWLQDNDTEMYSTHNEGKSLVTKRIFRTLNNKIYKYMTSISENVYIDKLADVVNKYNNTQHITSNVKPTDVKSNT